MHRVPAHEPVVGIGCDVEAHSYVFRRPLPPLVVAVDRIGVDAAGLRDRKCQQLETHDVDDRMPGRDERRLAAEHLERRDRSVRTLGGSALTLEDVGADALVDRREEAVEQLLGVVDLRRDPGALVQLQPRLLRRRPLAAGPGDEDPRLPGRGLRERKRLLDRAREPLDVLAAQRSDRRDRAGVARRVAPRLLDLRRADDDLVGELGERRHGRAGDEPLRAGEGPRRLERERRLALVRDADHQVGVRRSEHGLERCIAQPPVCAAWNDVPHPTKTTRAPSGSRRWRGTERSQSGWRSTERRV